MKASLTSRGSLNCNCTKKDKGGERKEVYERLQNVTAEPPVPILLKISQSDDFAQRILISRHEELTISTMVGVGSHAHPLTKCETRNECGFYSGFPRSQVRWRQTSLFLLKHRER